MSQLFQPFKTSTPAQMRGQSNTASSEAELAGFCMFTGLKRSLAGVLLGGLLTALGCATPEPPKPAAEGAARTERNSTQDWPTGAYQVAEGWPKPLPDTRHPHAGWTWGSMGSVYAETPDRIWVAQRGE